MYTNGISFRCRQWLLPMFLIICYSLFLAAVFPASASADTVGPAFSQVFPTNGATVNQTKVIVSLVAFDSDLINFTSLVMKVDGATVKPIAQFAPIDEWTDDYRTLEIYYPGTFTAGTHTIYVSLKDKRNNISTKTWSFTVTQPPKILSLSPANGATVVDRNPAIMATVKSGGSINPSTIVMTLNNTKVNAVFDQVYEIISYTPTVALEDETFYNVALTFKDLNGVAVSATWQFYTNTFQEMDYSVDDATCQKCHDRTKHVMTNCSKCHGINLSATQPTYPVDDCYGCHFNAPNPTTYHTNGLPLPDPPNHPVQVTYSCIECHNRTWVSTTIPSIHNIFNTAVNHKTTTTGCTACHSTSLTREHQRRQDADGNALTCFTCHNSPDPKVQSAIQLKDSSCAACHGVNAHPEHNNGLDTYCQTCHSATVLGDQQFHAKSDCALCHENKTNPLVKYAIDSKDSSCIACHDTGHNVNFIQKTPADIPVYPGLEWSVPQQAAIWAGETWFPDDFKSPGSKFMVSSHRSDLPGVDLFNWYTEQLTANGWQIISGPSQGSDYFTLACQKDARRLNVNVYPGASHNPAAPFIGCRVELLYK